MRRFSDRFTGYGDHGGFPSPPYDPMPKAPIAMRKIKDILRLHDQEGFTLREIARIQRCSPTTVAAYVRRAKDAGLSWPQVKDMPSGSRAGSLVSGTRSHAQPMPYWPARATPVSWCGSSIAHSIRTAMDTASSAIHTSNGSGAKR